MRDNDIRHASPSMHTTSPTLLEKLRHPENKGEWSRFVDLYTPLLYFWARRLRSQEADVHDLVQDVFVKLMQVLPTFTYDPEKKFRSWLRTVCVRHWKDCHKKFGNQLVQ